MPPKKRKPTPPPPARTLTIDTDLYDDEPQEGEEQQPLQLVIKGTRRSDRKPFEETFTCLPVLPSGSLLDLVIGVGLSSIHEQTAATAQFILACLEPESEARFQQLIRDKDRIVRTEALVAITDFLTDHFIGRPT